MKLSVSVTKGDGNIKHNKRAHANTPDNIDSKRSHLNVVLVDRNIREFYQQEFGDAVAQYNSKQKRADRQIDDYYTKIVHDKKTKLFQELVVQVGNKEEQADSIELTNQIYSNFLDDFQSKYPQLKVIGAYIHNDETTPHMHIDYVPVATYNKGLTKRVANNRALEQMGFTEWDKWHDSAMDLVTEKLNELGIERDFKDNHNKHLNIADYKELADKKKELQQEVADLEEQKVNSPARMVTDDADVIKMLEEIKDLSEQEIVQPQRPVSFAEGAFDNKFKKRTARDEYVISGDNFREIRQSYFDNVEMNKAAWHNHYLHEKVVKEFNAKVEWLTQLVKRALDSPVQAIVNKYNQFRLNILEQQNKELKAQNEALQDKIKALWRELHPEPSYHTLKDKTRVYGLKNDDLEHDFGKER